MVEEPANPYPATITDEASGIEVPNELHRAWKEGNQLRKAVRKAAETPSYEEWALEVIACICNETRVNSALKVEEIKCVWRRDGEYPENYADGDTPAEAWSGELGSIQDSQ